MNAALQTFLSTFLVTWTRQLLAVFDLAKLALTTAPCLAAPRWGYPSAVNCNASYRAYAVAFEQLQPSGYWQPNAFDSRATTRSENPTELELGCLIWALGKGRLFLEGRSFGPKMTIVHVEGASHTVPDALSRWTPRGTTTTPSAPPPDWDGLLAATPYQTRFLLDSAVAFSTLQFGSCILQALLRDLDRDTNRYLPSEAHRALSVPADLRTHADDSATSGWVLDDGLLFHDHGDGAWRLYVPVCADAFAPDTALRLILAAHHDNSGHFDARRTLAAMVEIYFALHLPRLVAKYVAACVACQESKDRTSLKPGPIGTPASPSPDAARTPFGYGSANSPTASASSPPSPTSTPTAPFASGFNAITRPTASPPPSPRTGTNSSPPASGRASPRASGNTVAERSIRTITQVLRAYTSACPHDWDDWLPLVEFQVNSAKSPTDGLSPFMRDLGFEPRPPHESGLPLASGEWRVADVQLLTRHLDEVTAIVRAILADRVTTNSASLRIRVRPVTYEVGERVWLDAGALPGYDGKLAKRKADIGRRGRPGQLPPRPPAPSLARPPVVPRQPPLPADDPRRPRDPAHQHHLPDSRDGNRPHLRPPRRPLRPPARPSTSTTTVRFDALLHPASSLTGSSVHPRARPPSPPSRLSFARRRSTPCGAPSSPPSSASPKGWGPVSSAPCSFISLPFNSSPSTSVR
ncbi:hypothetical protein BDK51DRAFT_52167 [Blyttiomyces helicus]|uniref:Integrase zinc-binding domain-containing protein n=1 Tax=Blyttiomyces helicus TaxID=388810 RepID=A0A4P9W9Z6_9FUNG|nr:hypothetical protein BDK51DRAFT_52167 [Blyttiomyces helicus]|eukprot:RKO89391.1 hypothetical protein BDK51DRAFT_52167 [Blyttiomyces helicus]